MYAAVEAKALPDANVFKQDLAPLWRHSGAKPIKETNDEDPSKPVSSVTFKDVANDAVTLCAAERDGDMVTVTDDIVLVTHLSYYHVFAPTLR